MSKDFTILIVPAVIILVFIIKYLVQRLYGLYYAKVESERLDNINRILQNNALLLSTEDIPALRCCPPPDYDRAHQCSLPIFRIHIDEVVEAPPPTYDEYMNEMTEGRGRGQPPPYHHV